MSSKFNLINYFSFSKIRIIYIIILSCIASSCNNARDKSDLVVGVSPDNPPYEYLDNQGKIVGIDIDIIQYIGGILGKKIIIKNIDFNTLIPSLKINDIDIAISGINYTPERAQHVDFSKTYYSTSMAFLCYRGDEISKPSDIVGKKIGVQMGTTWESYAKTLEKKYSLNIRSLSNNLTLVSEIKARNLDCTILEKNQAQIFSQQDTDLVYSTINDTDDGNFSIALQKGSNLTQSVNDAIDKMIQSGELNIIIKKHISDTAN